jgi:DNA-binding NarL/FixJ family response regulator
MRILLVDDHAVVRAGLRQLLVASLGAEVNEAPDAPTALALAAKSRPDLVILDLGLPGQGGLSLLPSLVQAGLRVLVLSMHTEPLYAHRALEAGARGYVSKNIAPEHLLTAIGQVAEGKRYIEQDIAQELALHRIEAGDRLHQLTPRDLDIMRLLAAGRSLSDIAESLGVSYKTIANTASLLRTKLGVARTADLIRMAIEMQS